MTAPAERNWLLTLAYDGTAYAGWQVQPGQPTVQRALNAKLEQLFRAPIATFATSRTDAGVHALDQRVTAWLPHEPEIAPEIARRALGKFLPLDIRVRAIVAMPPEFHARHAAAGKAYTYVFHLGPLENPILGRYALPVPWPVDVAAMASAAAMLLGQHDFSAFAVNPRCDQARDPVKTLYRCDLLPLGRLLLFTVVGNSFLYRMVRRLAGFLLAVGRGRLTPETARHLLQQPGATAAFDTVPPQGLFLDRVFFASEEMLAYRRGTPPLLDFAQE